MAERTAQRFVRAEFSHGSRPPTASPGGTRPVTILELFSIRGIGDTISLLTVRYELAMLVNNLVDQAVILGLLRRHNKIAFDVFLDFVHRLLAMIGQELVDDRTHAQNFFCMNIYISSLSGQTGPPGLMHQDRRVGQRE